METSAAAAWAELLILALPDEVHSEVWREQISPHIRSGQTVGFLHGFSVHFGLVQIPHGVGCTMVAPKGPGATLRERYIAGQGIPALLAVHQERDAAAGGLSAEELAIGWAVGLGCGRAAVVKTSFKDECETDLFGEQAVLCGGMLALARLAYETLTEAGYPPLLAYTECIQEIKQVADLLYAHGPAGMRAAISNTAEFGAYRAQATLADEGMRVAMRAMLAEIRSGTFARAMQADHDAGAPWFRAQRTAADAHPMETAGRAARALTPWLGAAPGGASTEGPPP